MPRDLPRLLLSCQACQEQQTALLRQLDVIEENFKTTVASIVKVSSAQDLQTELQHQQKLKEMQVRCMQADITLPDLTGWHSTVPGIIIWAHDVACAAVACPPVSCDC